MPHSSKSQNTDGEKRFETIGKHAYAFLCEKRACFFNLAIKKRENHATINLKFIDSTKSERIKPHGDNALIREEWR